MRASILLLFILVPFISFCQSTYQLQLPAPCENCLLVKDTLRVNACKEYWSPSGSHLWRISGTYHDSLHVAGLCDTLLIIDLYLTPFDKTLTQSGDTLISNDTGGTYQWMDCNSGLLLAGETGSSLKPDLSGVYAAIITKNGCTDTSECHSLFLTGINASILKKVTIYPNPTDGAITVDFGEIDSPVLAMLYSPDGRLVLQTQLAGVGQNIIQFPYASPGIYTLQLVAENCDASSHRIVRL